MRSSIGFDVEVDVEVEVEVEVEVASASTRAHASPSASSSYATSFFESPRRARIPAGGFVSIIAAARSSAARARTPVTTSGPRRGRARSRRCRRRTTCRPEGVSPSVITLLLLTQKSAEIPFAPMRAGARRARCPGSVSLSAPAAARNRRCENARPGGVAKGSENARPGGGRERLGECAGRAASGAPWRLTLGSGVFKVSPPQEGRYSRSSGVSKKVSAPGGGRSEQFSNVILRSESP